MRAFKFIKQLDSMQCGLACMAMICYHWGQEYSVKFLNKFCTASKDGVSFKGLSDLSDTLGLHCISGKVSIQELRECPLPAILHWNQNHFIVLYKIKNNKFYIADPSKGKLVLNETEFSQHFISLTSDNKEKGLAMFFEPTEKFGIIKDDTINNERNFKFLSKYIFKHKLYFIQIIVGMIFACCMQLLFPFLTQSIVDTGIHTKNIGLIWLILIGELTIVIGRTITDVIRNWLLLHISMRINISIVSDFFIKLLKLPMSFFDTKLMGDIFQRISDHDRIQKFLTSQILKISFAVLSFFIFGIVLCYYNITVFLIFLIGSFLYATWITLFLRKRRKIDYNLFEQQAANQNRTYQFITGIQEIKLQNCEIRRRLEWEDTQADLFKVQMDSLKLQLQQESGGVFINEIKNIVITVITATCVISGDMSLGMMLAVQYIIGQLNSPIEQVVAFIYSLQDVKISLERINEIHNAENEDNHIKNNITNLSDKTITIKNLSFSYDSHALTKTLDNITLNIPSGKITAIVGSSGSGKTTLIKLILGYYSNISGSILIQNQDIRNINLKDWRSHCGVVMQDGVIFSESIARNIAVEDGDIDYTRLEYAAQIANIHDYIMSLPLKYNTQIGRDGMGLSQGQKQRILIARAVYKNPDFIFLDEATNALDAKNEKIIVENLNKFYSGKTVVVVAHRLSTVKNADQIIVIDEGKVVESGEHYSLIAQKGKYYNLIHNQLELGL
ncbi:MULTISPECIES: peptidase domain-containing ABC transporter [Bacteroidales]|uniref:Peptidase domain-containing ABC transporter n=8 Tax=Bacteroidales TaxID=171549 RepID=A0A4P7VS78_9BACT|nr:MULTISPECIES: peptidase domain-containing ABC transporter [Bacteroidales]QCD37230.1 peptidase domain-containing ABC transporter [Muribaculum gordoncarteri]QCD37241.1 peptidase domain-containing ABC transporter [Muribaculum gordoncarteri]